jgi:hypothetical protein
MRNLNHRQFIPRRDRGTPEPLLKHLGNGHVQAPLFAFAHELVDHPRTEYIDFDSYYHHDHTDLMLEKIAEAQDELHHPRTGESLYDSIEAEGIKKPVTIQPVAEQHIGRNNQLQVRDVTPLVRGGHHRLFSAYDIDQTRDVYATARHDRGLSVGHNWTMVPLRYDDATERHHGDWHPDSDKYLGDIGKS